MARRTSGEVAVDERQMEGRRIERVWLEPDVRIHPLVAEAIRGFDAVVIGPGSFFTSLMPILLVRGRGGGAAGAWTDPLIFVTNILTEGEG